MIRALAISIVALFGGLVLFTFSTTDISETEIAQSYKTLSERVVKEKVSPEKIEENIANTPILPAGGQTGTMNDTNPLILYMPAQVDSTGKIKVTSGFKSRWGKWHSGIDLAPSERGEMNMIYSATHGTVTRVKDAGGKGLGKEVNIKDNRTGLIYIYGHLHTLKVTTGQVVVPGTELGLMGNTGASRGVHLHFEIRIHEVLPAYKNWSASEMKLDTYSNLVVDPAAQMFQFELPSGQFIHSDSQVRSIKIYQRTN